MYWERYESSGFPRSVLEAEIERMHAAYPAARKLFKEHLLEERLNAAAAQQQELARERASQEYQAARERAEQLRRDQLDRE